MIGCWCQAEGHYVNVIPAVLCFLLSECLMAQLLTDGIIRLVKQSGYRAQAVWGKVLQSTNCQGCVEEEKCKINICLVNDSLFMCRLLWWQMSASFSHPSLLMQLKAKQCCYLRDYRVSSTVQHKCSYGIGLCSNIGLLRAKSCFYLPTQGARLFKMCANLLSSSVHALRAFFNRMT